MEKPTDRTRKRARRMRRAPTYAEAAFWDLVRDGRTDGLKFRRQQAIGNVVADFACLAHRLIVEIDGGIHDLREIEDAERDAGLAEKGFRILRFRNAEVLTNPDQVLDVIRHACGLPLRHPLSFNVPRPR